MNEKMLKQHVERAELVLVGMKWVEHKAPRDERIKEAYEGHYDKPATQHSSAEKWTALVAIGEEGPPNGAMTDLTRGVFLYMPPEMSAAALRLAREALKENA